MKTRDVVMNMGHWNTFFLYVLTLPWQAPSPSVTFNPPAPAPSHQHRGMFKRMFKSVHVDM